MEQPLRLLVADGDPAHRLALHRALRQDVLRAQLVQVEDGPAALAALREQPFDCALLGLYMPGHTGLQVLREARAAQVSTPIILLTGPRDEQMAQELLQVGATDLLDMSTLSPELLAQSVRHALRLHRLEQQHRQHAESGEARLRLLLEERERLTRKLEERERLFTEVARQMPVGFLLADPEGRTVMANPQAEALWGRPLLPGVEGTLEWQERHYHLDGREYRPDEMPLSRSVRQGEVVHAEQLRMRRHDGEELYLQINSAPILDAAGRMLAATLIFDDITDRRMMEAALQERDERLRAALWASGTGTFRLDLRTRTLDWDENLDQLFGLPPGRTVHTLDDFLSLIHPEDRAAVVRQCEACVREGADFDMDFRVALPDGSVRWISQKGKTFVDAKGQPLYMTGACVDLTVQKRQEAEARQLAEFERQILGIVSHDLRNPLSTIRISASMMLAREGVDERLVKNLTRIISAADRATRLIRDLLDFSQARLGGGIRVQRKAMDLFELTQGVVEELATSHPDRRVELVQEGEGTGEFDGDRLAQVLGNLVGNAIQHSPPGSPIQVRCLGQGVEVHLTVHNGGPPIEPGLLPQLFEPFRRGRSAGQGTGSVGLGLYITRQLVLAHGGSVGVASTAETGTTFTVRLPRRPE